MTLRTSHKRGFVLENILKFPLPSFYAQLCTLFKYSSKLRQRFFCQGELLDVKDWNWTWCRANFLDACSLLKIIWHIFNFYCHCHPTGWFQIMANSKAHFALNMSQCTYSAGWYTIEGFMTLQLEDFFAKPSAFQWKMIFITFPFNDVTPLYYVFLFLFNAFFLQFIQNSPWGPNIYATK